MTGEGGEWADLFPADVGHRTYPRPQYELEYWMGAGGVGGKQPFAIWGDRDAPAECNEDGHTTADECDCDARWKWAYRGHYRGGADAELALADPSIDALTYIIRGDEPTLLVDGDDVVDPKTDEVHPRFLDTLERFGLTYADVSLSGSGAHAIYRGDLPDGVKQATWQLDGESWGANDDPPSIEIYDHGHVCVMTGRHVAGTPTEAREINAGALEAVLDEHEQLPTAPSDTPPAREAFDLDSYDPDATSATETTVDVRDVFAALDRLDARDVAAQTIVHRWNDDASTSGEYRAFAPTWGPTANGTANIVDDRIWQDTGDEGGYGGPVVMALIDAGEMSHRDASPRSARGALWFRGIDHLRELGFDVPEYDPPMATDRGEQYDIEECQPPAYDPAPFDVDQHRTRLAGERYERAHDADRPVIWADDAGSGKTTNAAIGAAGLGGGHTMLFDKHEKGREFIRDPVTPEDYVHLKGAEQACEPHCMDADHAGDDVDCPQHGDTNNCPRMCPIYDLPADHNERERFKAVMDEVESPVWAHILLEPHDGEGCEYLDQLDAVRSADHIVGVHEYLLLSTVTDDRQVIVDEKPRSLASERTYTVGKLIRAANDLGGRAGPRDATARTLKAMGAFARRIVDVATGAGDAPDTLADLEAPAVIWDTYEGYNSAAGNYVETVAPEEPWHYGEALARAKLRYNGTILHRMREDEWDGTPLCFDALLAAAIDAGLPREPLARAIAAPLTLADCPRCRHPTDDEQGAHVCPECDWDERVDTITQRGGECARADVDVVDDASDAALDYRELPLTSDLPDDPIVLDATATPERIGGLFGADPIVEGDTPRISDLHTTQILDGQYHYQTILNAIDEDRALADRIQRAIDRAGDLHERPLFVCRKPLIDTFDFPDHAEVAYYGGLRGLNFGGCDAVMCIGAPHPKMDDLEREAELLAQHVDGLRVGGVEHSTRSDAPNPPVYRKLRFEDDDGQGRAVPTKHYTGLVGALFREAREKELEQAVHRIRPLLADTDDTKHAYLLTNVPTGLPVDEVATFDELADPLDAMLPAPDGAIELLDVVREVEAGNGPDGFRAETLVDIHDGTVDEKVAGYHRLARLSGRDQLYVTERTVRNWIQALEDLGLLTRGTYEHRAGRTYTTDVATLQSALSVLGSNAGFEVAAVRRFQALAEAAGGSLAWLRWARDALDLGGDRCEWIPPPERTQNTGG